MSVKGKVVSILVLVAFILTTIVSPFLGMM